MPIANIESLLQPVSADAPCGVDLEYDPAFLELERISQGKPEQQMGSTIVPAQEPDWREVAKRTMELFAKTKDLRIAIRLTRALFRIEGLAGLSDGLAVMRGLVERFWDGFYPRLDPDDGNDPTFRVNILMELCDPANFVDRVRTTPIVAAKSFGRFSLRDIAISTGELPPDAGSEAPSSSAIDGAFMECPLPELQGTADVVRASIASLTAIEAFFGDKVIASSGPNFSKLTEVLRAADKALSVRLERRGVVAAPTGEAGATGEAGPGAGAAGPSMSGEINSREDVIRVLDKICLYYERVEPSSPIPILLKRSKRLVSANFLDILKDIAPDGLSQAENLRGRDPAEGG